MNRRRFLAQSLAATGGLLLPRTFASYAKETNTSKPNRPNIVFLLTDDHRYDSLGCAGNKIIKTPNLDTLAEKGTRFESYFITTAICMSSRASILTGQYLSRHGINKFNMDLSEQALANTYPMLLKKAGYKIGFAGKYGVGQNLPHDKYDYFDCFLGFGVYFPEPIDKGQHLTSRLGDSALKFLDTCEADENFCLSVSFKAPHVQDFDPRQYPYDPKYEGVYKDVTIPYPKTATQSHFDRQPRLLQVSEARKRWKVRFSNDEFYQNSVKSYYRLITGVDEVVGRITDKLREKGLSDNTIIIFSSDQGAFMGEHGFAGKWFMHEESIRAPLIIYDPRLPEDKRGRVCNAMSLNIDIAPTILELAGVKAPDSMQGDSLLNALRNDINNWRKDFLYEHPLLSNASAIIPQCYGVRNEKYKYAHYSHREVAVEQLFDLEKDPYEEHDLAQDANYSALLDQMRSRCEQLKEKNK